MHIIIETRRRLSWLKLFGAGGREPRVEYEGLGPGDGDWITQTPLILIKNLRKCDDG